jgi:hypothetical protein
MHRSTVTPVLHAPDNNINASEGDEINQDCKALLAISPVEECCHRHEREESWFGNEQGRVRVAKRLRQQGVANQSANVRGYKVGYDYRNDYPSGHMPNDFTCIIDL